jgi:lipopolysaccharide biosynthesis protein
MSTYEYVIHLHTKKSTHMRSEIASLWADDSWRLFSSSGDQFGELIDILSSDPEIGLAFALNLAITPPSSFTWGMNRRIALELMPHLIIPNAKDRFSFPAGGMFIARSKALLPLIEIKWSYFAFPSEDGALDGTTQHAIERLVGIVTASDQMRHLYYLMPERIFTTDAGFLALTPKSLHSL